MAIALIASSHATALRTGTFGWVMDFLSCIAAETGGWPMAINWPVRLSGGADMPRYFFNVYHERAELDDEGEELPDVQAAWHEATVTAGQIIQDLNGKLRPGQHWRLEVTDEFANPLYVIHVSADRLT